MTTRDKGVTLPTFGTFRVAASGIEVTDVSNDYTSQYAWTYKAQYIGPINVTNAYNTNPSSFSIKAQNANPVYAAAGGNVYLNPGTGSLGNVSGNLVLIDNAGNGGAWNTSHYTMGNYHLWFDSNGRLRAKVGAPTADADGYPIGGDYNATATWDPPSVASMGNTTTTVAISCTLGMYVQVSFSLSLQGMILSGYVSANGTVTVVLFNPTGGAIDLASGTLSVRCVRT